MRFGHKQRIPEAFSKDKLRCFVYWLKSDHLGIKILMRLLRIIMVTPPSCPLPPSEGVRESRLPLCPF